MSGDTEEKTTIRIDGEEVQIRDQISLRDERWGKTRILRFQEVGDVGVLHYRDQDTEETVYVRYIKTEDGLKINAYLSQDGKLINLASRQPIAEVQDTRAKSDN